MNAIETHHLTMQFGGLKAVADLDLAIPEKSIFGLIGPNGAGKTTVFNMLTGVYTPTSGRFLAFGKPVGAGRPHHITRLGLARTFQNIRLFKNMSVLENLLVALESDSRYPSYGLFESVLRTARSIHKERSQRERARELLNIFDLRKRETWLASNLPYGDQRRLEIARAIATGARVLLLDEPAAGLNPQETRALMTTIHDLRDRFGLTILLIEHDMKLVMGICERIAVLDYGVKIAEGTPKEIQTNPKVIEAYLGTTRTSH